jgi:GTP pyrophosphokinase
MAEVMNSSGSVATPAEDENNDYQALVKKRFNSLLTLLDNKMDDLDRRNVQLAFEIALEAHQPQKRKTGEPYILHPIEVARICVEEIGLGATSVICALLHDVVEDTTVTLQEIRKKFGEKGERIATIVDGLTKLDIEDANLNKQTENFRKVLGTLMNDVRVVLIKMADRLHNMRTLEAMSPIKQIKIASETSFIYAPLAGRLGLYKIKTEFDDLCMKIVDPENYQYVAKKINETKKARQEYIERFIKPVEEQLLEETNFKFRITGRPKSISSIHNKIKKKKVAFEQIYDLFAIRVILDLGEQATEAYERMCCWQVYAIVSNIYTALPERTKDFINLPKSNGYQSLHTTVVGPDGRFIEVQIRTERMNEIAERGFAAHWKYKGTSSKSDVYDVWLESIRDILEDNNTNSLELVYDFKNSLFQDEVHVFTPKGEMKRLPKGATALDFAYSIHSDVGNQCALVKINNRIVPISTELKNSDQVEITTKPNQKPSRDWLQMVTTARAKNKIRTALKEEQHKLAQLGKEMLERKLSHLKVNFEESIELIAKHFEYKSVQDLYTDLFSQDITVAEIFREFKVEQSKLILKVAQGENTNSGVVKPTRQASSKLGLYINKEPAEQYKYQLASCCNPVQGDQVFAYITINSGLKVHRVSCQNAEYLMANYAHRIMPAEWLTTSDSSFIANLKITGIDTGKGVIERMINEISNNLGLNIRSFNISAPNGYFKAELSLMVQNIKQLSKAINSIKNLENVNGVYRD